MNEVIKIGDVVMWKGCFNTQPPVEATITGIDLGQVKRTKYGTPVQQIPVEMKDYCCFSLKNGHWAYGEQILPIECTSSLQICDSQEVEQAYESYYS